MHITTLDKRGDKTLWKQNKGPKIYRSHSPILFLSFLLRVMLKMQNFNNWDAKKRSLL